MPLRSLFCVPWTWLERRGWRSSNNLTQENDEAHRMPITYTFISLVVCSTKVHKDLWFVSHMDTTRMPPIPQGDRGIFITTSITELKRKEWRQLWQRDITGELQWMISLSVDSTSVISKQSGINFSGVSISRAQSQRTARLTESKVALRLGDQD